MSLKERIEKVRRESAVEVATRSLIDQKRHFEELSIRLRWDIDTLQAEVVRLTEKLHTMTGEWIKFKQTSALLLPIADTLTSSTDNEATANPWWAIVAPNQMGSSAIMAGPYFSRESAERHRRERLYEYKESSFVFCFSGNNSREYKEMVDKAREVKERKKLDVVKT
jgi:hypothetical protein